MLLAKPCAAVATLLGGSLLATGCATLPASPVPAPLTDRQAVLIAEDYLDERGIDGPRVVNYVEPTGTGNFVSFRSGFDPYAIPPVASRLVEVRHDGSVRLLSFDRNE